MHVQVLDGSMDVGRKMKRAFCEPGNVADCPPLVPHTANIRPSSSPNTHTLLLPFLFSSLVVLRHSPLPRSSFPHSGLSYRLRKFPRPSCMVNVFSAATVL